MGPHAASRQRMRPFYAWLGGNRFDKFAVSLGAMKTESQKQPAARLWHISRLLFWQPGDFILYILGFVSLKNINQISKC